MMAIIFLCEISRQLACPLLRYFIKKDGRKLPSPTLPITHA